jgi:hypothetical protein
MRVPEKRMVFGLLVRRVPVWSEQFWAKYSAKFFVEILLQYVIIIIIIIIIAITIIIITVIIITVNAVLNIATEVSNMVIWSYLRG